MTCPACGHVNPEGQKFCGECGTALQAVCAACGAQNPPGQKFCGECGAALAGTGAASPQAARTTAAEAPAAERRLVSVLFADLVGFTTLSESRDAEEVRELLSRYFDTCRRLIELYGGTVEKFIGDAVMAVWGTPTATEDDAERAVRAALDLVAAVSALGDEVGAPELQARAGVLTGEAAVTIGAEGQGMVAGDLVNTASRVQSVAEPGLVYVGESTRRATEQTIVYEEAGSFELKGKEGLTPLWTARRVVSGLRGALKSQGLEAPFVGRERELRQIKDLFHACAEERKAHLVSVTGIAGIGKSRLAWEFYKYFDGITQLVYWHRGRCLAYGEGVTYWALADMVRMRCRIGEEEDPASALSKLRSTLEEHLLDSEERHFVEPRVAHLLGLAEHEARDRQELFAAWRLFFERLADSDPAVLVFEDMQWADTSLLDFVEYLLEWSRSSPLFVVTLARPELLERRPTWGAGLRNFSSLYLEPLSGEAMEELLAGLVPGLPPGARDQILARAEGVPLYAVETVRMLLDRGLLVQDGPVYRPTQEIAELEVPETLHALIASRLDGLPAAERRVLQDAAVLGKTFTREGLGALTGLGDDELEPLLQSLVRKEVLSLQADPRSPEHGQYGFLQDLVRRVAYETLSKRERRAKHLAVAEHLESAFAGEEDEVAEVVASHYVSAYESASETDDTTEIKVKAQESLARAGERAASLAAAAEARRYFERSAELAEEPQKRAALLDRAGWLAFYAAQPDDAERLLAESIALYEAGRDEPRAARVMGRLSEVRWRRGSQQEAIDLAERALEVVSRDEPDEELASLTARLGSAYVFVGELERAAELVERALDVSESLRLPDALTRSLLSKSGLVESRGHPEESFALLRQALEIAEANDLHERALTAYFNLSDRSFRRDEYDAALGYLARGLELAHRAGSRPSEWSVLSEMAYALFMTGRWDEAVATVEDVAEEQIESGAMFLSLLTSVLEIHVHRGELEQAQRLFSLFSRLEGSVDVQEQAVCAGGKAALRRGEGRLEEALEAGLAAVGLADLIGAAHQAVKQGFVEALEAALALGDRARAREVLGRIEALPAGFRPPFLEAQTHRFRARLDGDASGFEAAVARFRELGIGFWLAVTLLEHGELTGDEASLAEAREIFEDLRATPWLTRADEEARAGSRAVPVPTTG